jgi:hypothetical protein
LDKDVAPGWTTKQREAISHLDDSLRLLGEEATEACHRRWHSLPHDLQIREPHSPNTLQLSLLRTPWYKETLRKMKTKWIGLRMIPPLLLPVAPMANLNSEKEEEEWANIVKDKGYHDQQAITRYVAWDMRQEFSKQQ